MPSPSGLPVEFATVFPTTWANPSTPYDARAYTDVEFQIDGTFTPYVPQRSFTNGDFYPCNAIDRDGNILSSITTAGIYRLVGPGYFKLTGGAGATITLRVGV